MKSHKKLIIIFVAFIVVLALVAGGREIYKALNPAKADVSDAVSVKVADAVTGTVSVTSVYAGKVSSEKEVNVFPKIPGKVESVNVALGDKVHKGDILFKLDPSDISSQSAQAGISASGAKKAKDRAAKSVADAKKAEKQARNAISSAKKALLAAQTAQDPQAAAQAAKALEASQAGLAQAKQARAAAEAGYDQANTQYQLAVEGVKAAGDAISNYTVRSPISGTVTLLNVQTGGMAAQTMPAAVISNIAKISVATSVSESIIPKIKTGDAVTVKIKALSDNDIPAKIDTIVPTPPQGQTTYPVIITFDNDVKGIKPGMFAEITLTTGVAKDVITIPSDSVMVKSDKQMVAVLGADDKVSLVTVTTGLDDGKYVEITSGISVGERVIYEGQYYVDMDSKVKVV